MAGRSRAAAAVGAAAVAGYCWLAAGLRPFTSPMDAAVAAPIAVLAVVGGVRLARPGASAAAPVRMRQVVPWVLMFGLLAAIEMEAFWSSPRSQHPTLSSMADAAMNTHPGRALLFGAWVLLGWAILRPAPA